MPNYIILPRAALGKEMKREQKGLGAGGGADG